MLNHRPSGLTSFVFLLCIIGFSRGAVTCNADDSQTTDAAKRLRVGALLTLSGSFGAGGEDCRRGIEAALSESDTMKRLEIVFADSKNEATSAISEFRKLIEIDKVSAVYVNRAAMAMPLNPISKSLAIPLLGAVGHDGFVPGNDFAYQIWPNTREEGAFLAKEFLRRGHKKTAVIYSQDEWTQASAEGFRKAYKELGGSIVVDESVLTADTDFRSLLLKIKEADVDSYYFTVTLSQIAPIFKQAYALRLNGAGYTNFYVAKREVLDAAGTQALEGVSFIDIQTAFPHLHRKLGLPADVPVPALSVVSYVATVMLAQALDSAKTTTPADIHFALSNQKEVRTKDFIIPVEGRYVRFPLQLKAIRDGRP